MLNNTEEHNYYNFNNIDLRTFFCLYRPVTGGHFGPSSSGGLGALPLEAFFFLRISDLIDVFSCVGRLKRVLFTCSCPHRRKHLQSNLKSEEKKAPSGSAPSRRERTRERKRERERKKKETERETETGRQTDRQRIHMRGRRAIYAKASLADEEAKEARLREHIKGRKEKYNFLGHLKKAAGKLVCLVS